MDWYATEHDKVALFTTRLGIPAADLPRRIYTARRAAPEAGSTTRYFIHKLPIGLSGEPSKVSFAFLVTDTSGQAFAQFLRDHERLLPHLRDWEIVLVCPRHISGRPSLHGDVPRLRGGRPAAQPSWRARGRAGFLRGTPAT